jgi:putative transposase
VPHPLRREPDVRDPEGVLAVGQDAAALAEQHDEWTEGRRYLGLDVLARARITIASDPVEVTRTTTSRRSAPDHN